MYKGLPWVGLSSKENVIVVAIVSRQSYRLKKAMKGIIFPSQGAEPKVVEDLKKPSPGPDQILVKSVYVAVNPV